MKTWRREKIKNMSELIWDRRKKVQAKEYWTFIGSLSRGRGYGRKNTNTIKGLLRGQSRRFIR
jgi:hypothetical protein